MTLEKLKQAYYLRIEIEAIESKLNELYTALAPGVSSTQHPVRHSAVTSKTEALAIRMADLTNELHEVRLKRIAELQDTTKWITQIPDSYIRLTFWFRFIEGQSWGEVAQSMGGRNTAESARKTVYRYLQDVTPAESVPDVPVCPG